MKLHTDVIDYYISQSRNVDVSSLKKYGRSIADFMAFDPTLSPEELNNFVKHKLFEFEDGTQSQAELERIFRQSTQHITKFIKILYKDDMLKYNNLIIHIDFNIIFIFYVFFTVFTPFMWILLTSLFDDIFTFDIIFWLYVSSISLFLKFYSMYSFIKPILSWPFNAFLCIDLISNPNHQIQQLMLRLSSFLDSNDVQWNFILNFFSGLKQ